MSSKYRYLIAEKINELTMLQNYIQELEEKANKNTAHDVELFTVEVNKNDLEVSCYLYIPLPVFEKNTATCSRCGNTGFIREKNDFDSEYKMCDCKLDKLKYIVKEIPVYRIEIIDDNTWYVTYEDDKEIRINGRVVCDEYGEDFLKKFCKSRESCERLCDLINDKQ